MQEQRPLFPVERLFQQREHIFLTLPMQQDAIQRLQQTKPSFRIHHPQEMFQFVQEQRPLFRVERLFLLLERIYLTFQMQQDVIRRLQQT